MCEGCVPAGGWTRRRFLAGSVASGVALTLSPGVANGLVPAIHPRVDWAGQDRAAGPLDVEPDVRVLVVHHTVSANTYDPAAVPAMLREIHAFHTGPDKRWPDIAYHFVVDRFGGIWETRAGSLTSLRDGAPPVVGDATGGNQGFDQKCAFLGDHRTEPPSDAAVAAMAEILAALADRHGVATRAGSTAVLTSRGSNRWPAGEAVTVPTIAGHRLLSRTACPGDAGMAVVDDVLPAGVTVRRRAAPTTTAASAATTSPGEVPATEAGSQSTDAAVAEPVGGGARLDVPALPVGVAAAGVVATLAGALALRRRR